MKVFFSAIVECCSCNATGLYIGMAERDGAAVICNNCKGEGFREIRHEYNQFSGRKDHSNIKRVFKTAAGYVLSSDKVETADGDIINFQTSGCSYSEWKRGVTPKPVRDIHCPLEHYGQGSDVGETLKKSGPCVENLSIGGYIPKCSKENRIACWQYFDTKLPSFLTI